MSNNNSNAQKLPSEDGVSLHLRYGAQGFAIFSGIVAIVFGAWNCLGVLTISILSVLSGIFLVCMGIMVIANETPICGLFKHKHSDDLEYNRNKAIGYSIAAIPAVLMSPGLASIIACGLILITGILYGIIYYLEKKHQQPESHQKALSVNVYRAPHEKVAVNLTTVQVIPHAQPAENHEIVEDKNVSELETPNDNDEPIYPSLNI